MKVEYYNGHLCVNYEELIGGEDPLVKEGTLYSWIGRKKVRQVRKAFGHGVTALIAYDSLPSHIRKAFEERFGDPRELVHRQAEAKIEVYEDPMARIFYQSYTYDKGGEQIRLKEQYIDRYTMDASVLNSLIRRLSELQATRNKLNSRRTDMWAVMLDYSEALRYDYPHQLPSSEGGLRRKLNEYRKGGYQALISKKFGNQNTIKITEEAGEYIISLKRCKHPRQFDNAQILEEFNRVAPVMGWKPIDSLQSITRYLDDPSVKYLWQSTEEGETKSHLFYTRKNKTVLPHRRNSLWEGDGTRANLYYREGRKVRATDVYMVMDVATELFLGWAFGENETYEMQRRAYRMALERAGERPYDILTDNQGGHKKLATEGLFEKLALNYSHTTPYRPMAKLIESKFGIFQKKELHKYAHFTGTNMTAKGGRPNVEWLEANIELVPTYPEMIQQFEETILRWNADVHSTLGVPRQELYQTMHNDELPAVTEQDFIRIFWEETERPNTFTSSGLTIQVNKQEYTYEVVDERGLPDFAWRTKNTGRRFAVKYDPDDMTKACIYRIDADGGKRFERMLVPYLTVVRAKQEQTAEEAERIAILGTLDKQERIRREAEGQAIDIKMGREYVQPRLRGLTTEENERVQELATKLAKEQPLRRPMPKVELERPQVDNPPLSSSSEAPPSTKQVEVVGTSLSLGEVMKEESKLDYMELWNKQQGRRAEQVSKY